MVEQFNYEYRKNYGYRRNAYKCYETRSDVILVVLHKRS